MARFLLFTIVLLVSHLSHAQTDNYWTGNNSDNWNDAGNWALGAVPNSSHKAIIRVIAGKPNPVLHSNATIGFLDMAGSASLYLGGFELTTETVWVSYSNIHSEGGTLRAKMIRVCTGMHFFGNLTIHTDNGVGSGNTYHGDLTVYANPHIPAGQTSASCWPCGSLMFSYDGGDTFMGKSIFIKKNVGSLLFGVFFGNTEFQKPVAIIDSSSTGLYVDFAARGGTIKFKDSLDIRIRGGWLKFKSTLEFQKPVTFNQTGGEIGLEAWLENGVTQRASLATFKSDIILNKSGGLLRFGSWTLDLSITSRSTLESTGKIKLGPPGFTSGILDLTLFTINSASNQIFASSHDNTTAERTFINFDNATVNGKIHVKADNIDATGTGFYDKVILEKTGWAPVPSSRGGNTFYKSAELLNSGGYDWNFGTKWASIFKDSLKVSLSGTGQKDIPGVGRDAHFKLGIDTSSYLQGPVKIETSPTLSGNISIGSNAGFEIDGPVDISNFRTGILTFSNCKFRGTDLARSHTASTPGVSVIYTNQCLFEGPVTLQSPRISVSQTTFMKPAIISKTGAENEDDYGGNTFHDQVQFKNTATSGSIRFLSGEDKLIK